MIQDKVCYIYSVTSDNNGTNKETYIPCPTFMFQGNLSNVVMMNIQPATPELTIMAEGELFKTFTGFTTTSGVVEGMRITVSGTNESYTVKGRERFDTGFLPHYELVLIKSGR